MDESVENSYDKSDDKSTMNDSNSSSINSRLKVELQKNTKDTVYQKNTNVKRYRGFKNESTLPSSILSSKVENFITSKDKIQENRYHYTRDGNKIVKEDKDEKNIDENPYESYLYSQDTHSLNSMNSNNTNSINSNNNKSMNSSNTNTNSNISIGSNTNTTTNGSRSANTNISVNTNSNPNENEIDNESQSTETNNDNKGITNNINIKSLFGTIFTKGKK